jgi:hypothetical protein
MYLSAEQLTLANQAVIETFESCSVAWQVIPHWFTGDPGQTQVRQDNVTPPAVVVPIVPLSKTIDISLAIALSADPAPLINVVNLCALKLAIDFDATVVNKLHTDNSAKQTGPFKGPDVVLNSLITARVNLENNGFRSPTCVIANTDAFQEMSKLNAGYSSLDAILSGANANSLHRVDQIENPPAGKARVLLLGRRQLIPHGGGPDASAGEEPVDLAVSVPPSLEVVGEKGSNIIALAVRIAYALRVKDPSGAVTVTAN